MASLSEIQQQPLNINAQRPSAGDFTILPESSA